MNRTRWLWLGWGGAFLIGVTGGLLALVERAEFAVTQEQLQSAIDARRSGDAHMGVILTDVRIALSPGKVQLRFQGQFSFLEGNIDFEATTAGRLTYRAGAGEFYFRPEAISVRGGLEKSSRRTLVGRSLEPAVLRAVTYVLDRLPVHTLKSDVKGIVLRAVLKEVDVQERRLVARLTIWRLTSLVAVFGLVALVSVVAATILSASASPRRV